MTKDITNRKAYLPDRPKRCPKCGETIDSYMDAIVVIDPYLQRADGYCNKCYEAEKGTVDLETDIGLHEHRWEFRVSHWWCCRCNKRVPHPEGESAFEQNKPPVYLGMENKWKIENQTDMKEDQWHRIINTLKRWVRLVIVRLKTLFGI